MKDILEKLANAAGAFVSKDKKKPGMHFNPLSHEQVQETAMKVLLENRLFPVVEYENDLQDQHILVTCKMTIYLIDDPKQSITISGTSAVNKLDKFATGQAMSYSKKYAFLNALHLKTGESDGEDGYNAKPFAQPKTNVQPNPNAKAVADEFLKYLTETAKYAKNMGNYETQKQKFMQEFKIMDLKDSDPSTFEYVKQKAQHINEEVTKKINANK